MKLVLLTDVDDDCYDAVSVDDLRRMIGKGQLSANVVMAVLQALGMWNGIKAGIGQVRIDCREFILWLSCLNNRVIDQEACGFLKDEFKVDVLPDAKPVKFQIPDEFRDLRRLRKARRTAAICNYSRKLDEEARRSRKAREKRRREDEEQDSAPPPRRSKWDDEDEFAVEEIPEYYEDCCNRCFEKLTEPCPPDLAECVLCGRYRNNPRYGGKLRFQDTIRKYHDRYVREHGKPPVLEPYHVAQRRRAGPPPAQAVSDWSSDDNIPLIAFVTAPVVSDSPVRYRRRKRQRPLQSDDEEEAAEAPQPRIPRVSQSPQPSTSRAPQPVSQVPTFQRAASPSTAAHPTPRERRFQRRQTPLPPPRLSSSSDDSGDDNEQPQLVPAPASALPSVTGSPQPSTSRASQSPQPSTSSAPQPTTQQVPSYARAASPSPGRFRRSQTPPPQPHLSSSSSD